MGAKLLQPTMTGGELAPSLHGRVDIARYMASLKRCRNFIVRPYGGVENRGGMEYCYGRVGSDDFRLIPFAYSTDISYVLWFGDEFVRFTSGGAEVTPVAGAYSSMTTYAAGDYVTSGGVIYRSLVNGNNANPPISSPADWVADPGLQISSVWTAEQVGALTYTQSADVLYLAHPDVPTYELRRLTANSFELRLFDAKEGPFRDLNANETIQVAASGVQGTIALTSTKDIFTANAVGALFYLEPKNLGQLLPWVVGDRGIVVGDLRRSDGKTYKAVTVPTVGTWHETGPRQPIHEAGRVWDGGGKSKTNGVDTWSVGIEWEFVDTGYGVCKITEVTDGQNAVAEVTKRLPAQVVGGVGSPANTWTLSGDGTTTQFALAGAGFGVYTVTIAGAAVAGDPNYNPPDPAGGGPCVQVDSLLRSAGGGLVRAGDVKVGDWLELFDPETWEPAIGEVTYSETRPTTCWRVFTAREVSLVCSDSAPIAVRGGGYRTPSRLMGYEVPVLIGDEPEWDVVADLQRLGDGYVQYITVGDRNFWAAEAPQFPEVDPRGFLLHHNIKPNGDGAAP